MQIDLSPYQVYVLADRETLLVYYVGYSSNYLRRFLEHWHNWKMQELRSRGIDLIPYAVHSCATPEEAREYETRWILHCLQTYQPLVNYEAEDDLFVQAVRSIPLDTLNLPPDVSVTVTLEWLYAGPSSRIPRMLDRRKYPQLPLK